MFSDRHFGSAKRASLPFVKAPLDEDLGKEKSESVFRPENEQPSDEGPMDPEEKEPPPRR
jgi:hypothetical protein